MDFATEMMYVLCRLHFIKGSQDSSPKNSEDIQDGKACIILVDFRSYSFVGCHSRFLLGKKSTNFNIICYSL